MKPYENFADLIVHLRLVQGTKDKKSVLFEAMRRTPLIKDILRYTYDPDKQFYMAKKVITKIEETASTLKNYTADKTIMDLWEAHLQPLLDKLVSRELSGTAAINALALYRAQLTDRDKAALTCILLKDIQAGISLKTINAATPGGEGLIPEFLVQLANTYNPEKKYNGVDFWYASPKLDGIRAVYKVAEHKLYTRQGKEITGFEQIKAACKRICEQAAFSFLDGELFTPQYGFQEQQGAVVAKTCDEKQQEIRDAMRFNIFAALPAVDTPQMVHRLQALEPKVEEVIYIVPQQPVNCNPRDIKQLAKTYVDMGYEGIMLRHPKNPYSWKRDNDLLKFKFFQEMDLTIVDLFEGNNKYEGKMGGMICKGILEQTDQDGEPFLLEIVTEVGSGFTDAQRVEFWAMRDQLIGKTVEVQFQNITDRADPETGTYSLRFPTFLKLKEDR